MIILETERLLLRTLTQEDFEGLYKILEDPEVMYAYEHGFSEDEAQEWLDRQLTRYREDGFGLWAVILKKTGALIGQCGLTMQDCDGQRVPEIGYQFQKEFWHQGYCIEAASACREYAFKKLRLREVYSIIRNTNLPSQRVARRNGMTIRGRMVKHYYGIDMPHLIYSVRAEEISS